MRHIISLLMENEAGALSRVAGLFSARGYNIESLSVAYGQGDQSAATTGNVRVLPPAASQPA